MLKNNIIKIISMIIFWVLFPIVHMPKIRSVNGMKRWENVVEW